jgi:hypothetical protein
VFDEITFRFEVIDFLQLLFAALLIKLKVIPDGFPGNTYDFFDFPM